MRIGSWICCGALVIAMPGPAHAQATHVSLAIRETGIVLDARNATPRQILEEWQRVGGVRVINLDKLGSEPMTLLLKDISEGDALEVLLRDTTNGYVMSARTASGTGRSAFDTIVVVVGANSIESSDADLAAVDPRPATSRPTPRYVEEPGEPAVFAENVNVPPDQRPPTPIVRPQPATGPLNPFGAAAGVGAPGQIITGEAPPGFSYPRVTNPDLAEQQSGVVRLK